MKAYKIHLSNQDALQQAYGAMLGVKLDGSLEFRLTKIGNQRTYLQNASIHKYLTLLADEFNMSGITIQQALAQAVEREWTMGCAKENIWRPIQKAIFKVESSTELERDEVTRVYDTINRHTGEKFGLYVPFPCKENMKAA